MDDINEVVKFLGAVAPLLLPPLAKYFRARLRLKRKKEECSRCSTQKCFSQYIRLFFAYGRRTGINDTDAGVRPDMLLLPGAFGAVWPGTRLSRVPAPATDLYAFYSRTSGLVLPVLEGRPQDTLTPQADVLRPSEAPRDCTAGRGRFRPCRQTGVGAQSGLLSHLPKLAAAPVQVIANRRSTFRESLIPGNVNWPVGNN